MVDATSMDQLRDRVRSTLPENILTLMDDLEAFAEQKIAFSVATTAPAPNDPNPDGPAAHITHLGAAIVLGSTEVIQPQGILHELLHIQRYWIEQQPRLLPASTDASRSNVQITSSIDNAVEHLVIVPRESDFGFEPYSHWNATMGALWARYPWPDMLTPFARRKNTLMGWLSTDLLTDASVVEHMRNCAAEEGLLYEAEKFRSKMRLLLADKPRMLACVVRFLGIPRSDVRLVYMDVKRRQLSEQAVPHH